LSVLQYSVYLLVIADKPQAKLKMPMSAKICNRCPRASWPNLAGCLSSFYQGFSPLQRRKRLKWGKQTACHICR